ncbi:MAG TPA: response regulator transcription factor [Candidatus Polarisedimenticolaceae bacterium]|nr:response regulator transcription factor [Candidatus Polarisedimenticolaceae bacterium]
MNRARTLLVGGNDDFLDGIVDWIEGDADFQVVGRAHSGAHALDQLAVLRVDLVLMDVSLPDMSGFEVTRRMKMRAGAPLVVLLSFYDTRTIRLEALAAGADCFVPKSETTTRLKPLVGDLLHGRSITVGEQGSVPLTRPVRPEDVVE